MQPASEERELVSAPVGDEQLTRKQRREQARTERKALEAAERGRAARRRRLTQIGGSLAVLAVAGLVAIVATGGEAGSAPASGSNTSAGLQATPAPWAPEYSGLASRLAALKLPTQSDAGYHIHAALRVYVNGKQVPVPAEIGIEPEATSLAPLHTHDASGVIHIESSEPNAFTLGQFFTIWGVKFTNTQLGGYLAGAGNVLSAYVNGKPVSDPASYVVNPHDDIVVGFGKPGSFPTSFQYNWAGSGL